MRRKPLRSFILPRIREGFPAIPLGVRGGLSSADLDSDGDPDLVVAFQGPDGFDAVRVLANDGAGSFELPGRRYPVAGGVTAVLTADLDGDGPMDVAVSGPGSTSLLFNGGNGEPVELVSAIGGGGTGFLGTGDMDGDGRLDVIAANRSWPGDGNAGYVVLRQRDARDFEAGARDPLPRDLRGVAPADLDGDGDLDVSISVASEGAVIVHWNDGAGGLGEKQSLAAGTFPSFLMSADLDGDGRIDLAAPGEAGSLQLIYNEGSGALLAPSHHEAFGQSRSLSHGDFDGDGDEDVAYLNGPGTCPSSRTMAGEGSWNTRAWPSEKTRTSWRSRTWRAMGTSIYWPRLLLRTGSTSWRAGGHWGSRLHRSSIWSSLRSSRRSWTSMRTTIWISR